MRRSNARNITAAALVVVIDGPLRILRALVGSYSANGVPDGLASFRG